MTRRWSMRTRLLAAASLCLLLLGVVLYILDQSLENSRDQVYDTQFAFAEVVSRGITQTLTENQDVLTSLASDPAILPMDQAASQEVLAQAKELRPSLTGFFLRSRAKYRRVFRGSRPTTLHRPDQTGRRYSPGSGESAITDPIDVPEGDIRVIAMIVPVLAESDSSSEEGGCRSARSARSCRWTGCSAPSCR